MKIENDIEEVIANIAKNLFFSDPILFRAFCNHELCKNGYISVPFRSGQMKLEYNPSLLLYMAPQTIKQHLKTELTRIVMGHPYLRRPDPYDADVAYRASNITITQKNLAQYNLEPDMNFEYYYYELYKQKFNNQEADESEDENNESGNSDKKDGNKNNESESDKKKSEDDTNSEDDGKSESDEKKSEDDVNSEVDKKNSENGTDTDVTGKSESEINSIEKSNTDSACKNSGCNKKEEGDRNVKNNSKNAEENNKTELQQLSLTTKQAEDAVALWEENDNAKDIMRGILFFAAKAGINPGFLTKDITSEDKVIIPQYEKLIRSFKASVSAKNRRLTRMRPSRRSGFLHMGSRYEYQPYSILVAIDTSGSVCDNSLSVFFGAIKKIFKNGIKNIDMIQFDTMIHGTAKKFSITEKILKIEGRGGTSFQPVIDFVNHSRKQYDGLIIFTDGGAPEPVINETFNTKILWLLYSPFAGRRMHRAAQPWMLKSGMTAELESTPVRQIDYTINRCYGGGG